MVDPVSGKISKRAVEGLTGEAGGQESKKTGPSRFDQVLKEGREGLVELPEEVKEVSPAQTEELAADLRKRLESAGAADPVDFFRPEVARVEGGLERGREMVPRIQESPLREAIEDRLTSLDEQFKESNELIARLPDLKEPKELLKIQVRMHQLMQNTELFVKAVEQLNSGFNRITQMNI